MPLPKDRRSILLCLFLASLILPGCGPSHAQLHRSLLADRTPASHTRDLSAHYLVRHPDVLAIRIENSTSASGIRPVGIDGRITLFDTVHVLVEGMTVPMIKREIARTLEIAPVSVQVEVKEFRSQFLYMFGEVGEKHYVVSYRGPETIVDVLQRIGGPTEGAALNEVSIVRANVADGKPPEVFPVDLKAIVKDRDQRTNIRLEPFDRIHIGQSRSSRWACRLPPYLQFLCGKSANAVRTLPIEEKKQGVHTPRSPLTTSAGSPGTTPPS
jgi:protein involved in polysaccharide export with SLBB domain